MGACVLITSCSNNKKAESTEDAAAKGVVTAESDETSTENVDEVSLSSAQIRFADDDLSMELNNIISFDLEDYPLQVNGREVKLTIRVKGLSFMKDSFDADVVERLEKAKIVMALFDDNRTEIGNQRLELDGISFADLYKWIIANDTFEYKEVTFASENFTEVSKLKNLGRAKIYVEE
jgi:hypothetical protein